MKTLFNEKETYNDDGRKLCNEIEYAVRPIIKKLYDNGYKAREIENIAINSIQFEIAMQTLTKQADRAKKKTMKAGIA